MEEFAACWEELDDPRTGNAALHDFIELLVIALCGVLSGGQGAVDMGLYARAKEPFLRGFLKLTNGLGLSRKRVDKWIRLPALPEHNAMTPTPYTPAFFHEHLSHRWASGCTDGRKLFGEIKELGSWLQGVLLVSGATSIEVASRLCACATGETSVP